MAQESQQRLDAQFPWDDQAGVQLGLRLLTKVLEARLSELEGQRADYAGVIEDLTQVALTRINEVLLPTLPLLDQIIKLGFSSDKILDATPLTRELLGLETGGDIRGLIGAASQADVAAALATANTGIADVLAKVQTILGGADPLLDTFIEVASALKNDTSGLQALLTGLQNRLRFDAVQNLSGDQQAQAYRNLGITDIAQLLLKGGDQAALRQIINAQQGLGFYPVQQGGGGGQGGNKLKMGWDGGGVRLDVDGLDLGRVWTETGTLFNGFGYWRAPNGFMIQWGEVSGGDSRNGFAMSFPQTCFCVVVSGITDAPADTTWTFSASNRDKNAFDFRVRTLTGYFVGYAADIHAQYIALGY